MLVTQTHCKFLSDGVDILKAGKGSPYSEWVSNGVAAHSGWMATKYPHGLPVAGWSSQGMVIYRLSVWASSLVGWVLQKANSETGISLQDVC